MADTHDIEHFKKNVKACVVVFVLLLVLTAVTVWASYHHFGSRDSNVGNITVALIIATVKALMVAAYFMHLNSEKKSIYRILIFTGLFATGLMALTLWAFADPIRNFHWLQ